MSNIVIQGNEINAKEYVDKVVIEGIGEEKSLNPRLIVAKGGDNMINYSLEEQVIGLWLDGKPLYQKTVEITPSSQTYTAVNYPHGIENVKQIITYEAYLLFSSGSAQLIPSVQLSGSTLPSSLAVWVYVTTSDVVMTFGYDRSSCKVYITLRYTKTTD